MDLKVYFPSLESVNFQHFLLLAHTDKRIKVCLYASKMPSYSTWFVYNTCWLRGFQCVLKNPTALCHSAKPARCFWVEKGQRLSLEPSDRHLSPAGPWTVWEIPTSLPQGPCSEQYRITLFTHKPISLSSLEWECWTRSLWWSQIRT